MYGCKAGGGGRSVSRELNGFWTSVGRSSNIPSDRWGYVWYILKAVQKGFSDMCGSWGRRWPPKKVMGRARETVEDFWPIVGRPAWIFTCFGSSFHPCFQVVGPEPS